jgi:Phophatidylserine decarboxylase
LFCGSTQVGLAAPVEDVTETLEVVGVDRAGVDLWHPATASNMQLNTTNSFNRSYLIRAASPTGPRKNGTRLTPNANPKTRATTAVDGETTRCIVMDVRRRAGGLPDDQDDLESWLAGHRQRVDAGGEQDVLHPVRRVPGVDLHRSGGAHVRQADDRRSAAYRKRHLDSVEQMLRLLNEVLWMAPKFGETMVGTPLGAILDSTMGRPAADSPPTAIHGSTRCPRRS